MEIRTINFIFALVIGKSSTGDLNFKNVWDNKKAIEFFVGHFVPSFSPNETANGIPTSYYHSWRGRYLDDATIRQRKLRQRSSAGRATDL